MCLAANSETALGVLQRRPHLTLSVSQVAFTEDLSLIVIKYKH